MLVLTLTKQISDRPEKTPYLGTFRTMTTNAEQTGKKLPEHKLEYDFFLINNI